MSVVVDSKMLITVFCSKRSEVIMRLAASATDFLSGHVQIHCEGTNCIALVLDYISYM